MLTVVRRVLIVLAGLVALMLLFQRALTSRETAPPGAAGGSANSGAGASTKAAGNAGTGPQPTRAVTVEDVLEANLALPTRVQVSFPRLSYRQAHPEANDEPELTIRSFGEPTMIQYLRDPARSRPAGASNDDLDRWRQWQVHFPAAGALPPVEERLPINPAVTVGPDGPGRYGGVWRRFGESSWYFVRILCYESLTRFDPAGRQQPCLAYKWEVSPDWRVFTFHLRPGHRWSDGAPFTAHDITWACNTVIGSEYWSMPSDWMQATDGASLLYEEDVTDWRKLAARIVAEAGGAGPDRKRSPGGQLRAMADDALWGGISALAAGEANDPVAAARVTDRLNELFRRPGLYDAAAFAAVDLDVERRQLEANGISRLSKDDQDLYFVMVERADMLRRLVAAHLDTNILQPMEVSRLNLLLFRAAYRDLVSLPRQDRCKVEAVADGNGDDRTTIRFTFRTPNSIFLEQTATFMFYRGLFNLPRHATAPLHADGSILLADTDFWQWDKFWQRAGAEAAAPNDSPGRRLWLRMDDASKQKVQAGLPPRASDESDWEYDRRTRPLRREVVEAVNRVMTQRGYYEPNAWPPYDVQAAQGAILAGKGYSEMARDLGQLRLYRDLAILEDLLRRLRDEGPAALADEDHAKINVAMFRAAYADATKDSLVAPNRSAGLNCEAVRDPRRFQTWTERLFHRTEYHPKANPHHPTLGAWRLIDENDKPDIVAVRNPYYYRVDAEGRQLPYVDAVSTFVSNQKQINLLKLRSGNIDFQSADIAFDDFTVLKQGELAGGPYKVFLWAADSCGGLSFVPLQPHHEPALRRLQEDANVRRAMSLALNRRELIDVVYRGLGAPAQCSVPRGSPYYNPAEASAFIEYDPNRANRLLDAAGLDRRDRDGMRLLPDGQPLILDLNLTQDFSVVAASLAVHYWRAVGLNVQMKFRTAQMITRLEGMGLSDIRAMVGGGSYFGPMLPAAYYASHPAEAVQWGAWAVYLRSGGRDGEPAPERIHDLDRNWQRLVATSTPAAKMAAWKTITDRFAADLPMIGVTSPPGQVVVVRSGFKNVPRLALSGAIAHDPGNCCPEAFFFDGAP